MVSVVPDLSSSSIATWKIHLFWNYANFVLQIHQVPIHPVLGLANLDPLGRVYPKVHSIATNRDKDIFCILVNIHAN